MTTNTLTRTTFTLAEPHKASRVSIPSATLTFTGCDRERGHAPRATFTIPRETPASVNGAEVSGTVYLEHGRHFVKWLDRTGEGKAEHRIGWGFRDSYLSRVPGEGQFMAADPTDAQRKAIREFAESWADRIGNADVIRAAEAARLAEEAEREAGKAAELRAEAEKHDEAARARLDESAALADAAGLFAVSHNGKTESVHFTKAAAIRAATKSAEHRGSLHRYGTHSHDFPAVLDVFAGVWVPVPAREAMEAREEAERQSLRKS